MKPDPALVAAVIAVGLCAVAIIFLIIILAGGHVR